MADGQTAHDDASTRNTGMVEAPLPTNGHPSFEDLTPEEPHVDPPHNGPLQLPTQTRQETPHALASGSDPQLAHALQAQVAASGGAKKQGGYASGGQIKHRNPPPVASGHPPVSSGERAGRRLSALFVPPAKDDQDDYPEDQETSRLLPTPSLDGTIVAATASVPAPAAPAVAAAAAATSPSPSSSVSVEPAISHSTPLPTATVSPSRVIFKGDVKEEEEEETDRLSVLDRLEEGRDENGSDFEDRVTSSEDDDDDDEDDDNVSREGYSSYDDTICSNRSEYFKRYYGIQRGGLTNQASSRSLPKSRQSVNSLTSLIRERLPKVQPAMKQRTRGDVGLLVLVIILFIIIVVGVTLVHFFYTQHLLELSIFNRLKLFEDTRTLYVFGPSWQTLVTAHLGSNLPDHAIPYDCTHYVHYIHHLNHSTLQQTYPGYQDDVCLDWPHQARLQLRWLRRGGDIQCYSVEWHAARDDHTLQDCFLIGGKHGAWWGGGEMTGGGFPLSKGSIAPTAHATGSLGRDPWGHTLRRAWISAHGALVTVPDDLPVRVSANHDGDGKLCLEVRPSAAAAAAAAAAVAASSSSRLESRPIAPPRPRLNYTLCTAPNVSTLVTYLGMGRQRQHADYDPHFVSNATLSPLSAMEPDVGSVGGGTGGEHLSEEEGEFFLHVDSTEVQRAKDRLDHPVWRPWLAPEHTHLTEDIVLDYVEQVLSHRYGFWGHVLLTDEWQRIPGDLTFDRERFPDPAGMASTLGRKGFDLALTVHPYVRTDSVSFKNGTTKGFWVRQRLSQMPVLTQYAHLFSAAVADVTNPNTVRWLQAQLKVLHDQVGVDRFHLETGDSHVLPPFHEFSADPGNPDNTFSLFHEAVSQVAKAVSVQAALTRPTGATFVVLSEGDGSWTAFESIVPRLLTLAMLGVPLVDVGVIGGTARRGHVPEREIYIRWLELAAFVPALQVCVLPHLYDDEVVNLAEEYAELRKSLILPRLRNRLSDAMKKGSPLVQPLALYDPEDDEGHNVGDEMVVGGDILVAPVTRRGQRLRDVYLPKGIWKDMIDGRLRRGRRWLRAYKVPLTQIPHFQLHEPAEETFN